MQEFKEKHPIAYTTAKFIARVLLCTLGVIIGHFICRYSSLFYREKIFMRVEEKCAR